MFRINKIKSYFLQFYRYKHKKQTPVHSAKSCFTSFYHYHQTCRVPRCSIVSHRLAALRHVCSCWALSGLRGDSLLAMHEGAGTHAPITSLWLEATSEFCFVLINALVQTIEQYIKGLIV